MIVSALPPEAREMTGSIVKWIDDARIEPAVAAGVLAGLLSLIMEIIRERMGEDVAEECCARAIEMIAEGAGLAMVEVDADSDEGLDS